jgi:15-cis-phytoene synthase
LEAVLRFSHESMAKGSPSFAAAARLFPARIRDSAAMLYAACRYCDDLIDGQHLGHYHSHDGQIPSSLADRLTHLETETRRALAGKPGDLPMFQALHHVVSLHRIPHDCVMDFIEGFRMDVAGAAYRHLDDTLQYAYHVAGVVGVMMAMVMGVRDPQVLDRASDLGIGFQLTNIARDLVDDARMGRCYVPGDWLDEMALSVDDLAACRHADAMATIGRRLVEAAEPYYASALGGLPPLGFRNAWAIATAAAVYREIGVKVRSLGARAWDQRVSTSASRKLTLAALSSWRALRAVGLSRLNPSLPRQGLWTRPHHPTDAAWCQTQCHAVRHPPP